MPLTEVNLIQRPVCVCSPMRSRILFGSLSRAPLKGERARVAQRNDDGYVLLHEGETGFAPLELFRQVAVERNLAELIHFLLPLLCVGNLHGSGSPFSLICNVRAAPTGLLSIFLCPSQDCVRWNELCPGLSSVATPGPVHCTLLTSVTIVQAQVSKSRPEASFLCLLVSN